MIQRRSQAEMDNKARTTYVLNVPAELDQARELALASGYLSRYVDHQVQSGRLAEHGVRDHRHLPGIVHRLLVPKSKADAMIPQLRRPGSRHISHTGRATASVPVESRGRDWTDGQALPLAHRNALDNPYINPGVAPAPKGQAGDHRAVVDRSRPSRHRA